MVINNKPIKEILMLNQILQTDIHEVFKRLDKKLIDEILTKYKTYLNSLQNVKLPSTKEEHSKFLVNYLVDMIEDILIEIKDLNSNFTKFRREYSRSTLKREKDKILIEYAKIFGSKDLDGDKKAIDRYFDDMALSDRYKKQVAKREKKIVFLLGRIGVISNILLTKNLSTIEYKSIFKSLNIEKVVILLLSYSGDKRVLISSFKCLNDAFRDMPKGLNDNITRDNILKFIYRASLDSRQNIWVQCESLSLLSYLSLSSFQIVLKKRLSNPKDGDDIFLRARAIALMGKHLNILPKLNNLIETILRDESPFVRQALVKILKNLSEKDLIKYLKELIIKDKTKEVRALALLEVIKLLNREKITLELKELLKESLKNEENEFVLKVALKTIIDGYLNLKKEFIDNFYSEFLNELNFLHSNSSSLKIRRETSKILEKLFVYHNFYELFDELLKITQTLKPQKKIKLDKKFSKYKIEDIARVVSVIAQNDFSYQLMLKWNRIYIIKGEFFDSKSWRILYEFLNPAPDKREAFSHTIGRIYKANILIPSSIMSEVTKTKVPDEPFLIANEGNYRPYLPLLSQIDSSIFKREIKIFSFEGITKITPPTNIFKRFYSKFKLILNFNKYANLRNLNDDRYLKEIKKLNFEVKFNSYFSKDESVNKFFPVTIPFIDSETYTKIYNYFFSVYENSLFDLTLFITALTLIFFARNYYLSHSLKKARKSIPLVIGGWGSRGKSGTERIKAGLFNALGYSMVSKTTGCEAMFLYSHDFGKTNEMFLFRPYDKATIWEQYNLVKLSKELEVDVFLWECMGLTPSYIDILQKKWMDDDIATITNTYPDHEDLQGPAGINIPKVMTNFIPKNSSIITTEEEMTPILRDASKEFKTEFKSLGWLDAGLITEDILNRFPYEEHPYNIALVVEVAKKLGIKRDFTLKEMADNVVVDLGVLKAFPIALINDRQIEFINGMSANERFACLQNWERMGFDKPQDENTMISVVINNRADRVARSKVFANIFAKDISADLYFLIGTNLSGFMGYLKEAYDEHSYNITLFDGDNPKERVIEIAKFYKVKDYDKFLNRLDLISDKDKLDVEFRKFIFNLIKKRFIIIKDSYILGDDIIKIIADNTPKGFLNRVMGVQNIKGAGLDFVYKWLDWERIYNSSLKLQNREKRVTLEGLKDLASFKEFTLLSRDYLKEIIKEVKSSKIAQSEFFQNELETILINLNKKREVKSGSKDRNKFTKKLFEMVELFLDAKDAVKRRKKVDSIYQDLIDERISYNRAIEELKKINKRQKGGWIEF